MEANFMAQRYQVSLRTATWARDSHGLFDYESQSVQVKHLCTHLERMLIRNQSGDVHLINKKELGQLSYNGTEPLFKIVPDPSRSAETFRIDNCSSTGTYEESNDKMWLVLRSMKKNEIKEEYQLRRGDILKLGRMRLKVKDFRIQDAPDPCDRSSCLIEEGPIDISTNDDKPVDENDACRICFGDDSTIENPLFAPCKCTGTMKFIHYGCLKQWLNLKLVPRPSANLDTYFWKSFECEICKTIYPFCIKHNDEKKYLVDVNLPDKGNYLLLESLIHERNTSRIIHVIKPNAEHKEFKLGRGHDSDVRVSDISVSRIHASLICKENGFFIMDHNSKFGTLSLIPELIMEPSLSRAVQVGRTVISIQVVPLRLEPTLISTLISLDSVILQQIVSDSLRKSAAQEFELPELMQREEKKEEESKNEEIEEEPLSAKPKNQSLT